MSTRRGSNYRRNQTAAIALCFAVASLSGCSLFGSGAPESPPLPPSVNVDIPILDVGAPRSDPDAMDSSKGQPYRFADVIEVQADTRSHGVWSAWDESLQRWRLEIRSERALSLNLHFGKFRLPSNSRLTVFNPDNPTALAEFTPRNNKPHGQLWTPQFAGSRVILDLIIAPEMIPSLELELKTVNAAFR